MASMRPAPLRWLLPSLVLPALAILALNQSLSPGWPRNEGARALSDLIYSLPRPGTRLLLLADANLARELETELLIDRPFRTGFPKIEPTKPGQIASTLAPVPVFLAVTPAEWAGLMPGLPEPTCLWESGYGVLAYWAEGPVTCQKPSG
jgi:hypothetical protein